MKAFKNYSGESGRRTVYISDDARRLIDSLYPQYPEHEKQTELDTLCEAFACRDAFLRGEEEVFVRVQKRNVERADRYLQAVKNGGL